MQEQGDTVKLYVAHAWFARDVILGRIDLPSKEAMQKDSLAWRDREEKLETDEEMIWFQGDNVKELIEFTDYPTFDIEGVNKTFMEWEHHKHEDIMAFRNNAYRSLMTGTMSPVHHTPWMDALDDSMESYLKT